MKKFYSLIMGFIAFGVSAQSTFYSESFETTSGYTFPNGNGVGTNTEDFFDRTDSAGAPPQEVFNYTGFDGTYFIAGEDIDGHLSTSIGIVYLDNIDISGKTNLLFTAAFASGTNIDIDETADSVSVLVKVDNGSWTVIGRFRADSATTGSTGFNGQFAEDTNNDGYGDGTRLDGTFTDFSWPISGTGDSLDIQIVMDLQSGDEEAAFDNIRISGNGSISTNYTLQILHASDLEGGVEAIDRAKYFAAIVDTLEEEYANSITLSAGDNFIPGPFFNAAGDPSFAQVFNNVYNSHFGVSTYNDLRASGGRADISIMNIIGFDASAMGNHEFDAGTVTIQSIIEEDFRTPNGPASDRWVGVQFPYLSANLDFSNSSALGNLYSNVVEENTNFISGPTESNAGNSSINKIAAATFISEGGEKIGVVGATTPTLASISSPGDVSVSGPSSNDMLQLAAEIQPWIDSLTLNHGINKIILVTHLQQLQLEEQLAGLLKDVDVIIAGGSDAILANMNHRLNPGDVAVRPYPVLTPNADGDTLAIVSTNGEYSYVGRLVIEFDANGVLVPSSIDSLISGPYVTDSTMVAATWGNYSSAFADANGKAALVDSLTQAVVGVVTSKDGNVFGKTNVYLNGDRISVRSEETNFGNLSADANLWQAQQVDPTVAVSIKNGGGIRAAIGEVRETAPGQYDYLPPQANPLSGKQSGEVSQLDIENSLRFNNGLTLLDLDASGLKDVIEHGVAAWALNATPGQFCQVGGVKFSFDPSKAAGSRVQSLVIVDSAGIATDTIVKDGAVYGNASRTIRVVTLNFLAGGGDSYPFTTLASSLVDLDTVATLGAGSANFTTKGTEQDALAEYMLAKHISNPFNQADTDADQDERIQNLSLRADGILGVEVAFNQERLSIEESAGIQNLQVNYNNSTSMDREIRFNILGISTADASDYTIASLTDTARANTNGSFNVNLSIIDDNFPEADELIFLEIDADSTDYLVSEGDNKFMVIFIKDNDYQGPIASKSIKLNHLVSYQGLVNSGSTEILDYDPVSQRLFVTNANNNRFEILDFSNPLNIQKVDSVDVSAFGSINSLSVHGSVVACAIEGPNTMSNGVVAFYDTNGVALSNVTVGVLPDMVTFSPNGNTVVVACEGEPNNSYSQDPEGTIAIIDVSGGISNLTNSNVTLLNFNAYDSQINALKASGIRIFGLNASVSQDMEPEYVSISPDNNTAYVSCQENNALVIVNLTTNSITNIIPLGWKDHSLARNAFDTDRKSGEIHIASGPFRGFYMPDAITTYEVSGVNYIISANEGDARDYNGYSEEARFDDLTLNPDSFPNAEALIEAYGDFKVTTAQGDLNEDGIYEEVYTYGARSFSIWNGSTGALVYDSGDDFEQIISNHPEYYKLFNVNDDNDNLKSRSDDKGPEPESVTMGTYNNVPYAFVGMERTGGIMVYDVTNPQSPVFVDVNVPRDTADGSGDQGPEGLIYIDQANSPTASALLVASNEVSNTITVWEIKDTLTSINELSANKTNLLVYPNPAKDLFYVTAEGNETLNIELYDLNGRLLKTISSPKQVQAIDVSTLAPQIYLIKVETNEGIFTNKIIVE